MIGLLKIIIQRGGGTGPMKPRQPQKFDGAKSGSACKSALKDEDVTQRTSFSERFLN
jgi:hypothetical protein